MAETAALLVDHLLPRCRYRHWTCTFTGPLAIRLGYDEDLLAKVSRALGRRLEQRIRQRIKQEHRLPSVATLHMGSVCVVQRFRFDLGLFVHLHALWTDGAFDETHSPPRFIPPAPDLTPDDVLAIVARLDADVAQLSHDLELDDSRFDGLQACLQLGRAFGLSSPTSSEPVTSAWLVRGELVCLHAAPAFDGRDRKRLERQIRYMLRPPFALDAVELRPEGNVRFHFKQPTARGQTFTDLSPNIFLARLVALVPPPSFHMIRYHGVFASRHHLRAAIAFRDPNATTPIVQLPLLERHRQEERQAKISSVPPTPARLAWARLLARVFSVDVTVCPECSGRMKILKAVLIPDDIDEALARHGLLEPRGPPPAPTPTGQTNFPWTA